MTEERRKELEQMLDEAEASGDRRKIRSISKTMNREYRECTAHTADRLKRVESEVRQISTNQNEILRELRAWKNRVRGANWLWRVGVAVFAAVASLGVLKLSHILGWVECSNRDHQHNQYHHQSHQCTEINNAIPRNLR